MKCGQIVLVQYPFTDDSGSKVRPVLVVSGDDYNRGEDIVVVPLSSVQHKDAFPIVDSDKHFSQTRLRYSSYVKWTKPFVLSKKLIMRQLGALAPEPLAEIRSKIQGLFE